MADVSRVLQTGQGLPGSVDPYCLGDRMVLLENMLTSPGVEPCEAWFLEDALAKLTAIRDRQAG